MTGGGDLSTQTSSEHHTPEHHGAVGPAWTVGEGVAAWATFFVVSCFAKMFGPLMPRLGLPMLTGYIIVGVICGPFSLDIVHAKTIPALNYINQFALAYITMSAGAELIIEELKPMIKQLLWQALGLVVMLFGLATTCTALLARTPLLFFMNEYDQGCIWAIAFIVSTICVTMSPATAIAIVREMRCKGLLTTTMLGITVSPPQLPLSSPFPTQPP